MRMLTASGLALAVLVLRPSAAAAAESAGGAGALDPKVSADMTAALERGAKLMADGHLPEAIVAFELASRIAPEATSPWLNLGLAYQKLGNCAAAILHFERYVEMKGRRSEVPDADATAGLEYCKVTAAPRVSVESDPPAALVRLDDLKGPLLGETPLATAPIPLGLHHLYLVKPGFAVAELTVVGKYGELSTLRHVLTPMYAVRIKADVDGAVVKVDGNVVGRTPILTPIPMKAGEHVLELEKDGFPPVTTTVRVVPETREVSLSIPGVVPPPDDAPPAGRSRVPLYLGLAGGGAAAVAGVVVAVAVVLANRPSHGRYGPGVE